MSAESGFVKILNFIDGQFCEPVSGNYCDNINPSTGAVYSQWAQSNENDVELAVNASKKAFPRWKSLSNGQRSKILHRWADLIDENLERLAVAESIDNGKPISVSKAVDIPRSSKNLRFFADYILEIEPEIFEMPGEAMNYIERDPLGVVVAISPWNLPLYLFTWKVAPALAFGNTVVAKPSEVTPMTAFLLAELSLQAGVPPGVFNVVHGTGQDVGQALVTHPDVKAVTFTGSTQTGRIIAKQVSPLFKKLSLEMGGKNPNIVFADCDFESAISTTMRSSFANQGQICLCGSRVYVESSIYEKFKAELVNRTKNLVQGDPLSLDTEQGAVVSKTHFEKILGCIDQAKKDGGKIIIGGEPFNGAGENASGFFIQPTIIENLSQSCAGNQQEIFGPVITICPFVSEDQVIEWANGTEYGLAGSVWTADIEKARRVAKQLESGIVWINTWMLRDLRTPFGGMKNSGVGREGGQSAYHFFTEPKTVCVKLGGQNV
ncbi:MAG: 2-hydroxymuconic semialdehyde dehydrogenase [Bdellovibrionaceae bacterium]|nr:2-hydroxymuconic semialdehyde dehydrogenase [Pseudobdellovibrionaceae bacterium]|tara:strand:- start:161151 stop:162626 length:1476 start_codon:yes stop_codon:yes gene_type:complete